MVRERTFGHSRIELRRADLTTEATDAIVNPANPHLAPGAGVCGAIQRAGGDSIFAECAAIVRARGPLRPGEAAITGGGRLAARHVIHAVGPVWRGGSAGEALALASCYRESLRLAAAHGLESVAFPSISTGIYGYPVDDAAAVALRAVRDELLAGAKAPGSTVRRVHFALFSEADLLAYAAALKRLPD